MHLVVIKITEDGQREFIGSQIVEWRRVLKKGSIILSIEIGGCVLMDISASSVPKGILEIRLELVPKLKQQQLYTEEAID